MIPGIDLALGLTELVLQITQGAGVIERMNIAGDQLRQAANFRPGERIPGQQRRLWADLIQVLDDGERLDEDLAAVELERRHPHLGVDGAKLRLLVKAALLLQMYGHHLGTKALQIEGDAQ